MRSRLWFGLGILMVFAQAAVAQNTPRIGYAYPAGGRQGTTFHVKIGGQYLTSVTLVHISGAGVQARVIENIRPPSQLEQQQLRERLGVLQAKRKALLPNATPIPTDALKKGGKAKGNKADPGSAKAGNGKAANKKGGAGKGGKKAAKAVAAEVAAGATWTPADDKELADIMKKLAAFQKRRNNPGLSEEVTLEVVLAPNAEPGERELLLGTPQGLSNPLVFCVGQLPEFNQPEVPNIPMNGSNAISAVPARPEINVSLPAIVNGQIMPGGVDRIRFTAKQGTKLVASAAARELIPYLADAVPGWFQATLALYDVHGKQIAYDDDYRYNPDPVLLYQIPADGDYVLEIKDAIFRGREDFVYRITLGEVPFVTSIFPLGGPVGGKTTVELIGWNLPMTQTNPNAQWPGLYSFFVRKAGVKSNLVPFAADTLPETLEKEPNDTPKTAQQVTMPMIVNGRIGRPGDCDVYCFEGQAGSRIVAEVIARRLGSPLDSILRLTDSAGKQLACNDDFEDKAAGLTTHQADSLLSATLPANGTYFVYVGDTQHKGGPEYGYRLRISPPRYDFELRVSPSVANTRVGGTIPLTVAAIRKDGFDGAIDLRLKGAPGGFILSGARVPPGQKEVRVTLSVPWMTQPLPASLSIEGHATIDGRDLARAVVPAQDMEQAFAYHHLVPEQELLINVTGRGGQAPGAGRGAFAAAAGRGGPFAGKAGARLPGRGGRRGMGGRANGPRAAAMEAAFAAGSPAAIAAAERPPVKIPVGGTVRVPVGGAAAQLAGREFQLSDPPDGITIKSSAMVPGSGLELELQCDAKVKPGLQGNLIVEVFPSANAPAPKAAVKKKATNRRVPQATLPAIPFEVVQ